MARQIVIERMFGPRIPAQALKTLSLSRDFGVGGNQLLKREIVYS
jgi:hypothetical protein